MDDCVFFYSFIASLVLPPLLCGICLTSLICFELFAKRCSSCLFWKKSPKSKEKNCGVFLIKLLDFSIHIYRKEPYDDFFPWNHCDHILRYFPVELLYGITDKFSWSPFVFYLWLTYFSIVIRNGETFHLLCIFFNMIWLCSVCLLNFHCTIF